MSSLEEWLRSVGLGHQAGAFRKHDIDFAALGDLVEDDLREIGLTMGERKRFLRAVAALRPGRRPAAERRHLTVLFCDIVGSSALAERLEAEDVLDAMRRYQQMASEQVARAGGHVAKFLGDGVVAWFGYPEASESDADCALRAALGIVRKIGTIDLAPGIAGGGPDGGRLRVRIGIASGPVVIGDLIGSGTATEHPVAGVTPNLAARLQALAPPNGIVVSEEAWRLTANRFLFEDIGAHALQGFSLPVRAWRLRAERSRSDAADRTHRVPLAGREAERALLRELWRQAREVTGAILLIRGEPGIGKSRLVEDFLDGADEARWTLRFHGSEVNSGNPLYPMAAEVERIADIDRLDRPAERMAKLENLLFGDDADRGEARRVYASLLSLSDGEPADGSSVTPRQLKEMTLRALVRQICLASEARPVILVAEDMHWLDATTVELLHRLLDAVRGRRLLIVVTSRGPFPADWTARPGVRLLEMPRLPAPDCAAMVRSLTAERPLDEATERRIVERTDGVPLFVEELTRALVEARPAGHGTRPEHIPASLGASLMARLDRVGRARELAQAGSVLGRSFDRDLLARVSEFGAEEMDAALDVLVRADLLHADPGRGDGHPAYSFKHALVQDATYAGLLRDRRRALHARAAAALLELTPEVADLRPDLLARHYDEAGRVDPAIDCLMKAARRSLDRSAMPEAERHLARALELAGSLRRDRRALELRLEILVLLGPVMIFLRGPGSPEVERLYADAYDLCRELPETSRHFPISWGWWRLSRDFTVMGQRADALLERARAREDDSLLLQAHHCQWASHFNRGELARSVRHIDHGLAIYEAGDYRHHASLYGNHDAKVCGHAERALLLWLTGAPAEALAAEETAMAWAIRLGHTGSRAHALDVAMMHQFYRRDTGRVLARAGEMIALAEEQNFPDHRAKGLLFRGWAASRRGETAYGLEQVRIALARQKAIGTSEDFPIYYCMLADVLAAAGKPEEALAELIAAREEFGRIGLKIWAPEVERQIGRMMRLSGSADGSAVEAAFRRALAEARRQGATALELRAVDSIADLWEDQGRPEEAFSLLRGFLDRPVASAAGGDLEDLARARERGRRLSGLLG
ncbi:AAA family ATPase [Skermanella mucosa]|uniref:AAA family ATPase n=1 Tax=Skermanella mucosa TaxID=1789672 RepID=UPI00192B751F|nr:adenylate/guanylate cyclase domain-containing protein [Skermanella mucosa]UEM19910.1 AAA family ATPase [Skermanella mucosa]